MGDLEIAPWFCQFCNDWDALSGGGQIKNWRGEILGVHGLTRSPSKFQSSGEDIFLTGFLERKKLVGEDPLDPLPSTASAILALCIAAAAGRTRSTS